MKPGAIYMYLTIHNRIIHGPTSDLEPCTTSLSNLKTDQHDPAGDSDCSSFPIKKKEKQDSGFQKVCVPVTFVEGKEKLTLLQLYFSTLPISKTLQSQHYEDHQKVPSVSQIALKVFPNNTPFLKVKL